MANNVNGTVVNAEKEWTVMVYMSSDNSLGSECVWALTEMQNSLYDRQKVAVVAQFDSPLTGVGTIQYDFNYIPDPQGVIPMANRKLESFAKKQGSPLQDNKALVDSNGNDVKQVIEYPLEANFADPNVLEAFIKGGILRYQAQHYAVILSGLGNGAIDGLLRDSNPGSSMMLTDLRTALLNVKKDYPMYLQPEINKEIDVLGLDTCLMGMVEVASELTGIVRYLVASEGLVPGSGWPYRRILETISKSSTEKASDGKTSDLVCSIVDDYIDYYSDYITAGISVDQSACDLSQVATLEEYIWNLVDALTDKKHNEESDSEELRLKPLLKDSIIIAHWKAQSYRSDQHVDLLDFCDCLGKSCKSVKTLCKNVIDAIKNVVIKTENQGAAFQHSHGLAVYFPWSISELPVINNYKKLIFAQQTGWGAFLDAYVKDTQRPLARPELKDKLLVYPLDYYFIGQEAPRLHDKQVLSLVRDDRISPLVRDDRISPLVRDDRISPLVRDDKTSPLVRDDKTSPLVRDDKTSPLVRDDKTSPLVRDSGLGGCGTQTPSVTNPPTYFYKRPVNDLQATEQGQGAKKINGNCKLHTKANNKLRQSRKNISPPAKKK